MLGLTNLQRLTLLELGDGGEVRLADKVGPVCSVAAALQLAASQWGPKFVGLSAPSGNAACSTCPKGPTQAQQLLAASAASLAACFLAHGMGAAMLAG